MPTYEYACKSCGEHLEVVQRFSDDPLTECPACGGLLRKVYGSIGVSFKGSGFYRTDSRSSSSATRPTTGASGNEGSSGESSTSSDGAGTTTPAPAPPAATPAGTGGDAKSA